MKHLKLLSLLGVMAIGTTLLHGDTQDTNAELRELQELQEAHETQKALCNELSIKYEELSDLDRVRLLQAIRSQLLIKNETTDTTITRNTLLPASLTDALTSRTAQSNPLTGEKTRPNKSSKHATRTLYMVSTGPLRKLLPDPTSHRRHGPEFATMSAMLASPLLALLSHGSRKDTVSTSGKIAAYALLAAIIYSIIFYYHSHDDKEEMVNFIKHEWKTLSEKIAFPENVCTLMDHLHAELNAGTLDTDKMMDCMDALQNSGQNE